VAQPAEALELAGQVRALGQVPARALLDQLFAEPESGWLWDHSADEPWLPGP